MRYIEFFIYIWITIRFYKTITAFKEYYKNEKYTFYQWFQIVNIYCMVILLVIWNFINYFIQNCIFMYYLSIHGFNDFTLSEYGSEGNFIIIIQQSIAWAKNQFYFLLILNILILYHQYGISSLQSQFDDRTQKLLDQVYLDDSKQFEMINMEESRSQSDHTSNYTIAERESINSIKGEIPTDTNPKSTFADVENKR